MKNHADALIFHTTICEKNLRFFEALTNSIDAQSKKEYYIFFFCSCNLR